MKQKPHVQIETGKLNRYLLSRTSEVFDPGWDSTLKVAATQFIQGLCGAGIVDPCNKHLRNTIENRIQEIGRESDILYAEINKYNTLSLTDAKYINIASQLIIEQCDLHGELLDLCSAINGRIENIGKVPGIALNLFLQDHCN